MLNYQPLCSKMNVKIHTLKPENGMAFLEVNVKPWLFYQFVSIQIRY